MSSDVAAAHEKDAMHTTYCPNCGDDAAFDGQGWETKDYKTIDSEGRWHVTERRTSLRCPECGTCFLVVDEKQREPVEVPDDE